MISRIRLSTSTARLLHCYSHSSMDSINSIFSKRRGSYFVLSPYLLSGGSALLLLCPPITTIIITSCEDTKDKKNKKNNKKDSNEESIQVILSQMDEYAQIIGQKIQETIDTGIPTEISYGFICGYSSGYALKKVGKVVSVGFGLGFALLQTLAYSGYVQFNHEALKKDLMEKYFDMNHDGKVDEQDLKILYQRALQVLTYNIPGGAGFGAGFIGGLRAG